MIDDVCPRSEMDWQGKARGLQCYELQVSSSLFIIVQHVIIHHDIVRIHIFLYIHACTIRNTCTRTHTHTHAHRSVTVRGVNYSAGDYVLLQGSKDELICRLSSFVENLTDGQATALVDWLYWPREVAKELHRMPVKRRPRMPEHSAGEVFLSNYRDSVMAESILRKISVIHLAPSESVPQSKQQSSSGDVFYARWHWNVDSKMLTPVEGDTAGKHHSRHSRLTAITTTATKTESWHTVSPKHGSEGVSPKRGKEGMGGSPTAYKSKLSPDKPGSVSAVLAENPLERVMTSKLSVSLSRGQLSPYRSKGFLSVLNPGQPMPQFSSPARTSSIARASDASAKVKSKSLPQKPISSTPRCSGLASKEKTTSSSKISRAGARLGKRTMQADRDSVDEHPLPSSRRTKTSVASTKSGDNGNGGREGERKKQELNASPSMKRQQSRLSTHDVMGLLNEEDGEGEGEGEEEDGYDEEPMCSSKEEKKNVASKSKRGREGEEGSQRSDAGSDSRTEQVAEDYLSSSTVSKISCNASKLEKKWSLRTKFQIKPPTYLATCISSGAMVDAGQMGSSLEDEEAVSNIKKKSRKRVRSLSPAADVLVGEPAGKRTRVREKVPTDRDGSDERSKVVKPKAGGGGSREEKKKEVLRDDWSEGEASDGGRFELTVPAVKTTPSQGKRTTVRPHTVPRNKKFTTWVDVASSESSETPRRVRGKGGIAPAENERKESKIREKSEETKTRARRRDRNQSKKAARKTRQSLPARAHIDPLNCSSDDEEQEEEMEEEYVPDSDSQSSVSNSGGEGKEEEEEGEEEEEEEEPAPSKPKTPRNKRTGKVSKTPRHSKTPRPSKVSKTPIRTPPAGKTPRGRVVTPHIPQRKMKAGKVVGRSDFEKARLRQAQQYYINHIHARMHKHAHTHTCKNMHTHTRTHTAHC